jgi:hypothetical protein
MEGISPTLALAALVLGLAGHPHDAAENPRQQSEAEQPLDFECAGLAIVVPGETGSVSSSDYGLLDGELQVPKLAAIPTRPNETRPVALEGSVLALKEPAPEGTAPSDDIGALFDIPAQAPLAAEDGSGCDSFAPKP